MRVHRQAQVATGLVVVAVLLGSLWAGVLGASGAGNLADQLTANRLLLGVGAAVLPDRVPVLRPSAERPEAGGSMLLGMVLGALAAAFVLRPGGCGRTWPWSSSWFGRPSSKLEPRLASSWPDPCPAPAVPCVG